MATDTTTTARTCGRCKKAEDLFTLKMPIFTAQGWAMLQGQWHASCFYLDVADRAAHYKKVQAAIGEPDKAATDG